MPNLIEGAGLTKRYDGFTLDNVSISVPEGYVVGLIGSNGAGKTTIIKALLGLNRLDGGKVCAFGESPKGGAWKRRVGVVFDTCAFVPTMHVSDIASIGKAAYANWDGPEFNRLLNEFDISPKKKIETLSRGMGMKLSLAFALAHHPELLILDEPTAGLDPIARDEALEYLREFMNDEGRGILISSHITSDLEKIADRIVCVDAGRVIFSKEKDDICGRGGVARCAERQFAAIGESGFLPQDELYYLRRDYQIDVFVPDRFAFTQVFPDTPCDPISLDDYMLLMLKGGAR